VKRRPLRIWLKRWKALAIVVGFMLQFAVFAPLAWFASDWLHAVISALFQFAIIYGSTRVFRGPHEVVAPPRPWWKMTAGRPAGFLLAALFLLVLAQVVVGFTTGDYSLALLVTSVAEYGVLAALYLFSSFRLPARAVASATPST